MGQTGIIKQLILSFCLISPLLLLLQLQNVLGGIGKPHVESLNSRSVLPSDPPYWSNMGHKIADFEFLAYISFIVAYSFGMYYEVLGKHMRRVYIASQFCPTTPLMVQTGVIK